MRPAQGIGALLRESLYASHGPPQGSGRAAKSTFQHTQSSSCHTGAGAARSAAARASQTTQQTTSSFARRLTSFLADAVFRAPRVPVARPNVAHASTFARSAGRTFATSAGPCLRHAAVPRGAGTFLNTGTSVGLGSARKFSSGAGRTVFDNVVRNVPVWARAAGDEALDESKRKGRPGVAVGRFDARKIRRELRREARRAAGIPPKGLEAYLPKAARQPELLVATPALVALLSIPLEPVFRLSSPTAQAPSTLLPPAQTLRDFHSIFAAHGSRLSQLESKLRAACAWDDAHSCSLEEAGARMVIKWVTPRGHEGIGWGRAELEQALGMWSGEERWFAIDEYEGVEMLPPGTLQHSTVSSEPDTESLLDYDSFASLPTTGTATPYIQDEAGSPIFGWDSGSVHDVVASSLRLPSPELPNSGWSSLHSSLMSTVSLSSGESSPAESVAFGATDTFASLMDDGEGSDTPSWISHRQALRQEPPAQDLWDVLTSDESSEGEWADE